MRVAFTSAHTTHQKIAKKTCHKAGLVVLCISAPHRAGCTCMAPWIALIGTLHPPADTLSRKAQQLSSRRSFSRLSISPVSRTHATTPCRCSLSTPSQRALDRPPLPMLGDRVSAISSPEKAHTPGARLTQAALGAKPA